VILKTVLRAMSGKPKAATEKQLPPVSMVH